MQSVIIKVTKSWTGDKGIEIHRLGVNEPIVPLPEYGKVVWMGEGWRSQFAFLPEIDEFVGHLELLIRSVRNKGGALHLEIAIIQED
jgi:hypothetical protein